MKKVSDLIGAARRARRNARAAHSGFKVGAALETRQGQVYGGCNVENSTYGLTVCAERVAIWKALSEGETAFRRMAIVADSEALIPPCGACRQIIWEYCGDIELVLANLRGRKTRHRVSELFPQPFDNRFLSRAEESAARAATKTGKR